MDGAPAKDPLRRFAREHERALIVVWLASIVCVLGVGFVWGIGLRGFERVIDAREARWPARVDEGARLVAAKRFDAAAQLLERTDAGFPARTVKHRLDRERERLLTLLAQCYVELDKKAQALATCERLVAFDARNWQNHATQARVAAAFSETELAQQSLDRLLAIHPTHLPSVEARIAIDFSAGRYAAVPALWRAYVEAYRLATIEFSLGDARVQLEVPADGHPHRFEVPFQLAAGGASARAVFATHGWSFDVRELAFAAPERVGVEGLPKFTSPAAATWTANEGAPVGEQGIAAASVGSSLERDMELPPEGVARAAFDVIAYKACTPSLWQMVETSYRNLLLWDELETLRARTRAGGCLEAGSLFDD